MSSVVYVTGVPGAGKSTIRGELRRLGKAALGVDEDHIGAFHTLPSRTRPASDRRHCERDHRS